MMSVQANRGSDRHVHDVLISGNQFVANLQGGLEGQPGFLLGDHDLGQILMLTALESRRQLIGLLLRLADIHQMAAKQYP